MYEPSKTSYNKIQKFKQNGGLYCINYSLADINLYGSWIFENEYSALDIMAVPCGMQPSGFTEPIREDCVWDRQEALNYLGTISLIIVYNQGVFK